MPALDAKLQKKIGGYQNNDSSGSNDTANRTATLSFVRGQRGMHNFSFQK